MIEVILKHHGRGEVCAVSLMDGVVTLLPLEGAKVGEIELFEEQWESEGIMPKMAPHPEKPLKPRDGRAFLEALPRYYIGPYLWAEMRS
jgi:hypothetical protein